MITFVLNIGQQRRDADVPKQVSSLTRLKENIAGATSALPCPKHGSNSSATILLRGFYYGSRWEILDSCCDEFRKSIESAAQVIQKANDGGH
jgi:hypothetical protein